MNILARVGSGRLARVVMRLSGHVSDTRLLAALLGLVTKPSEASAIVANAGRELFVSAGPCSPKASVSFGNMVAEPFLDEAGWMADTVEAMTARWDGKAPRRGDPDAGGWVWDGSRWLAPVVSVLGIGTAGETREGRLDPAVSILWAWENDPLSLEETGRTMFAEDWRWLVSRIPPSWTAELAKAAARDGGVPGVSAEWLRAVSEAGEISDSVVEAGSSGGAASV